VSISAGEWHEFVVDDCVYLDGVAQQVVIGTSAHMTSQFQLATKTISGPVYFDDVYVVKDNNIAGDANCPQRPEVVRWVPFGINDLPGMQLVISGAVGAASGFNGTYSLVRNLGDWEVTGLSIPYFTATIDTLRYRNNSSLKVEGYQGVSAIVSWNLPAWSFPTNPWDSNTISSTSGTSGTATVSF
jgi:hypothetical protein